MVSTFTCLQAYGLLTGFVGLLGSKTPVFTARLENTGIYRSGAAWAFENTGISRSGAAWAWAGATRAVPLSRRGAQNQRSSVLLSHRVAQIAARRDRSKNLFKESVQK